MDVNILVIKAASVERLDCLMEKLKLPVPPRMEILAHESSVPNLHANYPDATIIEYPHASCFSKRAIARLIRQGKLQKKYDFVFIPISNVSGGGHHNVLWSAFLFNSKVRLYNINDEFVEVYSGSVMRDRFLRIMLFPMIISGTLLLSAWGIIKLFAAFATRGIGVGGKTETIYGRGTG